LLDFHISTGFDLAQPRVPITVTHRPRGELRQPSIRAVEDPCHRAAQYE
jgi:hypothetical protein